MAIDDRSELDELAHSIAYENAVSAIECASVDGGNGWMDVSGLEPFETDGIERDIRYLEMRGLLVRHSGNPGLVQILDESEEME